MLRISKALDCQTSSRKCYTTRENMKPLSMEQIEECLLQLYPHLHSQPVKTCGALSYETPFVTIKSSWMFWQKIQLEYFITESVPCDRVFSASQHVRQVTCELNRDRNSAERHSYIVWEGSCSWWKRYKKLTFFLWKVPYHRFSDTKKFKMNLLTKISP